MVAHTSAGTILYIGTTQDDMLTDNYVPVGEIITIPEFGRQYTTVKYNPIATRGTQKFKGSFDDGTLAVKMAKVSSDAGQQVVLKAVDKDFFYNIKILANDKSPPVELDTVAITAATPGVVSWPAHGFPIGTAVSFTGTLPSPLVDGTAYFVTAPTADNFELALSYVDAVAGVAIDTSTGVAASGVIGMSEPSNTTQYFKAMIASYTTIYDQVDAVTQSTMNVEIMSGSINEIPHLP